MCNYELLEPFYSLLTIIAITTSIIIIIIIIIIVFEELKSFSSNISSHRKSYTKKARWIENTKDTHRSYELQMYEDILLKEIMNTLERTHKSMSPEMDKITNFSLHHTSSTHQLMTKLISEIIKEPEKMPDWLTERLKCLLPKTNDATNTKKDRPITCLLTSILKK